MLNVHNLHVTLMYTLKTRYNCNIPETQSLTAVQSLTLLVLWFAGSSVPAVRPVSETVPVVAFPFPHFQLLPVGNLFTMLDIHN
jgi:hypothetical protein